MEISPFLHRYATEEGECFFNSLNLEMYQSIQDAPSPEEDYQLLQTLSNRASKQDRTVMGTVFLTTRCPRKCSYCFLRGVPPGDMNEKELDGIIQLLSPGPGDLLLYGGEPLLRPDLIRHVLAAADQLPGKLNVSLATGGYPVSDETVALLAKASAFIIVSIDGQPDIHNRIRPFAQGDSFLTAENTFIRFREGGCRVGISVTVTEANVQEMPGDFLWLMDHFEPDDMGLNPWLHPGKGGTPAKGQVSPEKALQAITESMELAISRGMYIEQLARRVRPFVRRTPRLKDCAAAGGRVVGIPGGKVGACDCMTVCGDHGVALSNTAGLQELLNQLKPLSPVNFPGCQSCPVIGLCGGGCRYDAFHASGSLQGLREERCRFERLFLKWMIEKAMRHGRDSLVPAGGFAQDSMPMPVGTMIGEYQNEAT